MRIGIDLSPLAHSARRGIGAYTRSLLAALGQVGAEHEYVLFGPRDPGCLTLPPKHVWWQLSRPLLGRASALVSHQAILPVAARRAGVDVLHVVDVPIVPSHPAAPLWKTVPLVVTLHDLNPLYAPPLLRKRRWRTFYRVSLGLCRRADALLVDSESTRDDALRAGIAAADRTFVAPLASPPSIDCAPTAVPLPPEPYGLHVGGDDWNKNRETVLSAAAEVNAVRPFALLLVGGSPPRAADVPPALSELVVHHTWLEPDALRFVYEHAAMLIFPSRHEGFGLPILEAMAAGTPVITSDRGATREVAGDAALLVEPEASSAIARAALKILDDEQLASDLRARGLLRVREFDWCVTASATLSAYRYAIEHPR